MDYDVGAIDAALSAAEGNREIAGLAMDLTTEQVQSRIYASPYLRSRWTKAEPLRLETRVFDAPPAPKSIKAQIQLSKEVASEDARFADGFSSLGMMPDEVKFATSLQAFHRENISNCVGLFSGGISAIGVRLMILKMKLSDRLSSEDFVVMSEEPGKIDWDASREREKSTWENFHRCCQSLVEMSAVAQNGAAIRAKIDMWKKQAVKPKGKQSYGPTDTKIINNGVMAVNQ